VLARDGTNKLNEHLQDFRRAVYQHAWKARVDAYWTGGMNDEGVASAYQQLLDGIGEAKIESVEECLQKIPKWVSMLRPGGCGLLLGKLKDWVLGQSITDLSQHVLETAIRVCELVDPSMTSGKLKAFSTQGKSELAKLLSQSSVDAVMQCLDDTGALATGTSLSSFAKALEQATGAKLEQNYVAKLTRVRFDLFGTLKGLCKDTTSQVLLGQVNAG
jgi:hypothetical protein